MGVKCLAVYRDGCKESQPLNTAEGESVEQSDPVIETIDVDPATDQAQICPQRKRLPDTRNAIAHKFAVGGREGYIHVGLIREWSTRRIIYSHE